MRLCFKITIYDANGRWNYEVVVRSQGKEWGFEVDRNGKLLRTHGEKK